MRRWLLALAVLAGCAPDFEDQSIVLDLRILGMRVSPPELVVPFDPDDPESIELEPVELCALVADPGVDRRLAYEMVACPPTEDGRCDEPDEPFIAFASGNVPDPELAPASVEICGTLPADPRLIDILRISIEDDPLQGFSSVAVQLELFVKPDDGDDADGVFGAKRMLYAPQIPEQRVANTNPSLAELIVIGDGEQPATLRRCADDAAEAFTVRPDQKITLEPIEPEGVREDYVLPTFDGGFRMFTENLTYAWFATAGEWDALESGGPTDPFGNVPQIENEWRAPQVETPTLVDMWMVQRDERGGIAWYEMCARVEP